MKKIVKRSIINKKKKKPVEEKEEREEVPVEETKVEEKVKEKQKEKPKELPAVRPSPKPKAKKPEPATMMEPAPTPAPERRTPKPKRTPLVKKPYSRPPPAIFEESSSVSEDTIMKLRREAADKFEWNPPAELFARERQRTGIGCGNLVGVSSFGGWDKKGDADEQWIRSEKKKEMRKKNSGKSFVFKSSSSADTRRTINLAKLLEAMERKEKAKELRDKRLRQNTFADDKMFYKMINILRERAIEDSKEGECKSEIEEDCR